LVQSASMIGWHRIADSTAVTGEALHSVEFAGAPLVVYRDRSGKAHVASAKCPHNGIDLNCNRTAIVEGAIACPLHGWLFDAATGRCTLIPYNPPKTPENLYLKEYRVDEREGAILLWWDQSSSRS
jgi:3-ketosteroid 9alpha-monooxygenase subunit A